MEDEFYYRNLSCCSVEICWRDFSEEENILYELYQNKDLIYQGNNTSYEVINLNTKEEYIFLAFDAVNKQTIKNYKGPLCAQPY